MDGNIFNIHYDGKVTVTLEWKTKKEEWRALMYEIESLFQRENIKNYQKRECDIDCERKVILDFCCKEDACEYKIFLEVKFKIISISV